MSAHERSPNPRFLDGAELPPGDSKLLVALSGGPDSTALLFWLKESGRAVVAAHFDHALRAGSASDREQVEGRCAGLGVDLIWARRDTPLGPGNLQAAARQARYRFLERARLEAGAELIVTGHTADDVVEGMLLHLLRGSAVAGLRGMPRSRGRVNRPLLSVWRTQILEYLKDRDRDYLEDPSNADTERFARARIRHQLLPRLERDRPGIKARLLSVSLWAERLQLEIEAAAELARRPDGLSSAELARLPRAVRYEAYRQLYGDLPGLHRRHLQAIDQVSLEGHSGQGVDLPRGRRLELVQDRVRMLDQDAGPAPTAPELKVSRCPGCASPAAVHLRPEMAQGLHLGYRRPGLRMSPLPYARTRKLQDILVDARVPRGERDRLPLVFVGDQLVWVPGIALDSRFAACGSEPSVHLTLEGYPAGGGRIG